MRTPLVLEMSKTKLTTTIMSPRINTLLCIKSERLWQWWWKRNYGTCCYTCNGKHVAVPDGKHSHRVWRVEVSYSAGNSAITSVTMTKDTHVTTTKGKETARIWTNQIVGDGFGKGKQNGAWNKNSLSTNPEELLPHAANVMGALSGTVSICVGLIRSKTSPWPSCPLALDPHEKTRPLSVKAIVWKLPHDNWRICNVAGIAIATGIEASCSRAVPDRLPKQKTLPSSITDHRIDYDKCIRHDEWATHVMTKVHTGEKCSVRPATCKRLHALPNCCLYNLWLVFVFDVAVTSLAPRTVAPNENCA